MSTHTPHRPTLEIGLQDDCERCREHAEHPFASLDPAHIADLWRRMVRVEVNDDGTYRSEAEARACRTLWQHYLFLRRYLPDVDASRWPLGAA